jgi:hypothetical protein
MGGVLCPDCAGVDSSAPAITPQALKVLRNLQTNESVMLQGVTIHDDIQREVERFLQDYIVYRLESRPRAVRFLERLRTERVAP